MPYHIDEENSELAFEVREGNKLVIKIKSNIFSDSLELYLIKVGDNTEPTDKNVFSSLRVLKEIENLHDTILKEINSVTSGFWELKQDSQGNEYIATKYNVLTEGGLTTYGLGKQKLGTIYDGLPIDNDTIYWEEVEGSRVLKAKGSGGGSTGLDETKLWNVLGTPGDQQIDYSHLRSAFSQFSNDFVTINTEQEITALKHFTAGLSVGESKKKIYEENGVVYIDADVAVTGAMTFYATAGRTVSTIMDAVTVDGITIKKENNVLKAVSGAGNSFDENAMWSALSGSSDNQINKSHLTTALDGYATQNWVIENYATKSELSAVSNKLSDFLEGSDTDNIINKWKELEAFLSGMAETDNLAEILETKADKKYVDSTFVTLATKQTITGEKTFSSVLNTAAIKASGAITAPSLAASDWVTIAGIKLRKLEDGALMLEGNLALTGALTMYASNGQSFDTIYDGLPIDNDTIYWQEVDGSRVLKAREGSGSSFDKSAMWTALAGSTTEQINKSHLTTALTGYATESWVSGKNYAVKATTLAGYGITDAYTKKESDGKYPTKTGSGASGTWGIGITGNAATASKWATARTITLGSYLSGSVSLDGSANVTLNANVVGLTSQGNKTAATGNTSPASGVRLYQVYNNGYPTPYGNLLSVKGGGAGELLLSWANANRIYYRSLRDNGDNWLGWNELAFITDNVASATKLQTARTLWGQSFNGTKNVSGDLNYVGNINFTLKGRLVSNSSLELSCKNDDTTSLTFTGTVFRPFTSAHNNIDLGASTVRWRDLYIGRNAYVDGITKTGDFYIGGIRLHKTADGVITLEGNLAVTGGITTYAIDPVSASTIMDGVVVDGVTIKKENGKLVAVGGGEAGSVAWENISGKPSVFATNIANITDLHSSWDSVLAAQKPAWLTAVSIATISDLNSGWDALLKAAPSSYVTRWPTFAEVTSKPTTLAGYGITDAPTKTGSGASGTWDINISGNASNADKLDNMHLSGIVHSEQGYSTGTTEASSSSRNLSRSGFWRDNNRARIGIFACHSQDTKYGWELSCGYDSVRPYFSVKTNGSWKSDRTIAFLDDNVSSANQLANTRTLWGQNFNGTQNVSGDMSNVGNIDTNYAHVNAKTFAYNPSDAHDNGYPWYGFTYGGDSKIHISGYGGILFYTSAGNVLTLASDARVYANSYVSNDWFRSEGDSGWYSIRGGGGWYMSDTYFIRSYGEKSVYIGNGSYRNAGGGYTANNINNASEVFSCRFMSEVIGGIPAGNIRNILGWYDSAANGWTTSYIIGSKRNYNNDWGEMTFGVYQYEGSNRSMKMFMTLDGAGQKLYIEGNILATGGSSFYGSDIRYKSIIHPVLLLALNKIAEAPSFVYRWNKQGMNQNRLNLGGSAQYTQSVLPWAVEEKDNFLSMDYATVAYTFAVHTARHLLTYETRTDKKIKKLEREIVILKKQLKKLGYEEVRTLDDQSV